MNQQSRKNYYYGKEAQEVLGYGHNKVNVIFADIERKGLIQRKRQGLESRI